MHGIFDLWQLFDDLFNRVDGLANAFKCRSRAQNANGVLRNVEEVAIERTLALEASRIVEVPVSSSFFMTLRLEMLHGYGKACILLPRWVKRESAV